jgi:hypothetical protein
VEAIGTAVCRAYATQENADLGGSRFVGPVELRGARGRVWLHGRRIPARRLWAHAGGRVTGSIWSVVWRIGAAWFLDWGDPMPRRDETIQGGDFWLTSETRSETVSWPVAKSRLVSSVPVARTRVSQSEAALPALMGVRGVTTKMAAQALEKARTPSSVIQMEVPFGRKGGMTQLHLEVSNDQHDALMRVLSGA